MLVFAGTTAGARGCARRMGAILGVAALLTTILIGASAGAASATPVLLSCPSQLSFVVGVESVQTITVTDPDHFVQGATPVGNPVGFVASLTPSRPGETGGFNLEYLSAAVGSYPFSVTFNTSVSELITCSTTIVVAAADTTAPMITCPAGTVTVIRPSNLNVMITPASVGVTASDDTGLAGVFLSPNNFSADFTGFQVAATAIDTSGNVAGCTFLVDVVSVPVDSDGDGVPDDDDAFPNDPTRAVRCPPGRYGAFSCQPADPGSFASGGTVEQTPCPVGTFASFAGAAQCDPAPVGSYVDQPGQTSATACPPGTSTEGVGAASIDACLPDTDGDGLPDTIDPDDDNDGVGDEADRCAGTVLPDAPTNGLKKNRYAANESGTFVDGDGQPSGLTLADTGGCSASQIIVAAGLGNGHAKFGISQSALWGWITG